MSKPIVSKNIQIPDEILRQLLTPSEQRMLKNRWQILNLLNDGLSIRRVAAKVGVGTDTVVRVARMAEKAHLRLSLGKEHKIRSKTPWIFGKNS